jgi:hypothetical protein
MARSYGGNGAGNSRAWPARTGGNGAGNSWAWPARTGCYGARDSGFTCVESRRRLLRYINLSDSAVRVL